MIVYFWPETNRLKVIKIRDEFREQGKNNAWIVHIYLNTRLKLICQARLMNSNPPSTASASEASALSGASCLLLLAPPKKVVFLVPSVCLSVCLSVCPSGNWKSCERILTKFLGGVAHGPGTTGTKEFNFGDDPDHCPDPWVRSPKSAFTGLLKKLPTDFDEILWRTGVWPRDQLFTFWWRSASLSGSESPFRITIRIREELPQFY